MSAVRTPGAWAAAALLLLSVAAPNPGLSQEQEGVRSGGAPPEHRSSAYLPLGHWAYPILEYWHSVGRTDDFSPFVRPYRRGNVARLVHRLASQPLEPFEREWVVLLEEELAPELDALNGVESRAGHLATRLRMGGGYRSQTHRDPLRPELEGRFSADRILEHAFVDATGRLGPVAGGVRVGRDGIFLEDAQFPDGRVVPDKKAPVLDELGLRVEEGYLELQTEHASLFFGRMYRNWGPSRLPGFVRSDYAYSEEELAYRVGTDRVFLTGSLASYADFRGDTTRYLSTHRLEVRPLDGLVLAATEAILHGGPSQPLVFTFLNPLGIWHNARADGDPPKNAVGQLDLWWRPTRGLALYGSWLLDATKETPENLFCCQQGFAAGVELPGVVPGLTLRASGSAVQSLTYRTPFPWEEWSVEGIGLGWDKTDLYLFTLEADWLRTGGLLLRPRIDLQILGEGDFREPRPTREELEDFPVILLGETETTVRPALAGRWRSNGPVPLDLEWDLGVNLIDDAGHVATENRTEFVGSVRLVLETPPWLLPLKR